MEKPCYTIAKVEGGTDPEGGLATAAVVSCAACGETVSGWGGPSPGTLCEACGDAISRSDREALKERLGPPDPILTWADAPLGRRERRVSSRHLHLGSVEVASMNRREKWWAGHLELPGVALAKDYAPEEQMAAMIEDAVRAWVRMTQSS